MNLINKSYKIMLGLHFVKEFFRALEAQSIGELGECLEIFLRNKQEKAMIETKLFYKVE
jgi:hypothetical protein